MKRQKQLRQHTIALRIRTLGLSRGVGLATTEYYCTSCGKILDEKDRNKRCKSTR